MRRKSRGRRDNWEKIRRDSEKREGKKGGERGSEGRRE